MDIEGRVRRQSTWPFWTVIVLTLPAFALLLIWLCAIVRPTGWVYLTVPLIFVASVGLVVGIIIAAATRHSVPRRLSRSTWIVLGLAVLAALATIVLIGRAASKPPRSKGGVAQVTPGIPTRASFARVGYWAADASKADWTSRAAGLVRADSNWQLAFSPRNCRAARTTRPPGLSANC